MDGVVPVCVCVCVCVVLAVLILRCCCRRRHRPRRLLSLADWEAAGPMLRDIHLSVMVSYIIIIIIINVIYNAHYIKQIISKCYIAQRQRAETT